MPNKFLIYINLICCLAGAGCVLAPAKPSWAGRTWQDNQEVYFSGISSSCKDIVCARSMAYANAADALAQYIGITIKSQTRQTTENNWQSLESSYIAVSDELHINNISIEKFEVFKESGYFTGYILLKTSQNELQKAKNIAEKLQKHQQALLETKKQLGPFYVRGSSKWEDLTASIEQFLKERGYQISKSGRQIKADVPQFYCVDSTMQDIKICTLQVNLEFKNKKYSYESKGYGANVVQARREAVNKLVSSLTEEITGI